MLLVDRATFPGDTICGHCIPHHGVIRLQQWGLLDKVSSNVGDFALRGNAEDTAQFCAAVVHALPAQQFYAPSNLQRIMRQAALVGVPE